MLAASGWGADQQLNLIAGFLPLHAPQSRACSNLCIDSRNGGPIRSAKLRRRLKADMAPGTKLTSTEPARAGSILGCGL